MEYYFVYMPISKKQTNDLRASNKIFNVELQIIHLFM